MSSDAYSRRAARAGLAVAAVATLYLATAAALGFLALFAEAAWLASGPATRIESVALAAAVAAAAVIARSGLWPAARQPAAQVFRYIIWIPILIGGPAGLAVLGIWWAIVTLGMMPRARGFVPSGLRAEAGRHPRLVQIVAEAARAAGGADPGTLYLDVNARVEVGRTRGRTVVVIGLYALALLDPDQLRALLTHEYAHLAPGGLAYRLHARCYRLLGHPQQLDYGAYLFFPRLALGLRATVAAAREHEAWADRCAASAWGAEALEVGRLRLAVASAVQVSYHQQVLAPVLMLGSRPDLVEGLRHWLASPEAEAPIRAARLDLAPRLMPRFAAHPPRSESCEQRPFTLPAAADAALACIESPWLLEEQLAQALGVHLKHVPWEAVARELYLHNWEQVLTDHGDSLRGWTPRRYPELCRDLDAVGRRLLKQDAAKFTPAYRARMAETILGISLAMCVKRAGWNVYDLPGQPLWLERAVEPAARLQQRIEPFALVAGLQKGKTSEAAFLAQCDQAGILDCDISGAPA